MTKSHIFCMAAALVAMSVSATPLPKQPVWKIGSCRPQPQEMKYLTPQKQDNHRRAADAADAAFTVESPEAHVALVTENFDASLPKGWEVERTEYVTWNLKQIAPAGDAKSFSTIDPNDVKSLYVTGDYRVYNREISSVTTTTFDVPVLGSLQAYIGFSQNMDDCCRLIISVSTDDFASESIEIWNSKNETGDKAWRWHPINVPLTQWAGKQIRLRFTYTWGSGDETFKTGGYLGDFAIDGLTISGLQEVSGIEVLTGEKVKFIDITGYADTTPTEYTWKFPGATPSSSSEASPEVYYTADGKYDVTLEVRDDSGNLHTRTIPAYVSVTGTKPTAKILPPATFKFDGSDAYMVAPMVPVKFRDASEGFPTSQEWTFMGHNYGNADDVLTLEGSEVEVGYGYLHQWPVGLEVSNSHGSSSDLITVAAEYEGLFSNMPKDAGATNYDMEDWGMFPGSNTRKITAFAEKFSAPSRPMLLQGAYVYFTKAQADELYYQIQTITVRVYTAGPDGKPDKQLDFGLCDVIDLNTPSATGTLIPTAFEFTDAPVVDGDFFIVVDGIPEFCETCCVSFAMTPFAASGGTAWMCKEGEWMEVSSYFPAGQNHTSYCIKPYGVHSVMSPLTDPAEVQFGKEGGSQQYEFFSYMGYKEPVIDSDWLRITSPHGDMTVETLTIEADALPDGMTERKANITLTDGLSELVIPVVQNNSSGIQSVDADDTIGGEWLYYNLQGIPVSSDRLAPGIYIRTNGMRTEKVVVNRQ